MIAAGQGKWGDESLRPQFLEPSGGETEGFKPRLHLQPPQGPVPRCTHGPAPRLPPEQAVQNAPDPQRGADITLRPRPLPPCIDVLAYLLDEREVGSSAVPARADKAHGRLLGQYRVLLRVGRKRPYDLITGDADLGCFLQAFRAVGVLTPVLRRMTQSGWATWTRS